jgi:CRISPR/Cas system CSM-associated protein Csm2 small subunit
MTSIKELERQALAKMRKQKRKHSKSKTLRLYEVDRWNEKLEKWEDVVVLAPSMKVAQARARGAKLKRVEDFI